MILQNAVRAVFTKSLKLKKNETCLIVADKIKEDLGKAFYQYASCVTPRAKLVVIEPTKEHAVEPPADVAKLMLEYDVQILVTEKSLTHTKARRDATKKGARIATMPSITEEIANRCLDVDYDALKKSSVKLYETLKNARKVRVTTALGTDIHFVIGKSEFFGRDGGVFDYPGSYGNLPEGEIAFGPETCEGVYVVDASFPGLGRLKSPLTFRVSKGMAYEITGHNSEKVMERLDKVGPGAYWVAELGIGLNPKAIITGNILEDEKVIGTVHVALGNDLSFGGKNDVPIHLDGIITAPDIYLDGNIIMKKGKFI